MFGDIHSNYSNTNIVENKMEFISESAILNLRITCASKTANKKNACQNMFQTNNNNNNSIAALGLNDLKLNSKYFAFSNMFS